MGLSFLSCASLIISNCVPPMRKKYRKNYDCKTQKKTENVLETNITGPKIENSRYIPSGYNYVSQKLDHSAHVVHG